MKKIIYKIPAIDGIEYSADTLWRLRDSMMFDPYRFHRKIVCRYVNGEFDPTWLRCVEIVRGSIMFRRVNP